MGKPLWEVDDRHFAGFRDLAIQSKLNIWQEGINKPRGNILPHLRGCIKGNLTEIAIFLTETAAVLCPKINILSWKWPLNVLFKRSSI